MPVIFPIRIYYAVAFLLLIALIITCIHRAEFFDEAWFAEQSYFLLKDGVVRSEFFSGYNGWGTQIYVFHKLFVIAGAGVMAITGFTVAGCKVVSLLFGALCGFLIWRHERFALPEQRWLSMVLFIGSGTLIRYVAVNRPEVMCMTLGFASWFVLSPQEETAKPKYIFAAVLAGMAALTHLNGVIYLIAGAVFIFIKSGWRNSL